jgi:hypothetical protein
VRSQSEDAYFIERYAIRFALKLDEDWSYRQQKLYILKKFYDSSIYDALPPYQNEYDMDGSNGNYIPIAKRRPSIIYNLPKVIVNESTGMLFGEQHFPIVRCNMNGEKNQKITDFLAYITDSAKIKRKMLQAAKKGAIGSVCIVVKVLKGKFYLDVMRTQNLTPYFDRMEPEKLIRLVEKKKVDGYSVKAFGYPVEERQLNKMFFFVREWTKTEEIYYVPYPCEDENESHNLIRDDKKSTLHKLGFVPAIWIKNISEDEEIDGESSFECIIDNAIEISYQLSQLGRLFKYSSDPTLVVKNPSALKDSELIKGSGVLNLDEKGDAYYAEMKGSGAGQVMEYVRLLREFSVEVARGNRSSPEKLMGAPSGTALKLLNAALISLVGELRLTYGEDGLIALYTMILEICKAPNMKIDFGDNDFSPEILSKNYLLDLDWPELYPTTPDEDLQKAQTVTTYTTNGILSKETAMRNIADDYNIIDIKVELNAVEKEIDAEHTRQSEVSRGATNKK